MKTDKIRIAKWYSVTFPNMQRLDAVCWSWLGGNVFEFTNGGAVMKVGSHDVRPAKRRHTQTETDLVVSQAAHTT